MYKEKSYNSSSLFDWVVGTVSSVAKTAISTAKSVISESKPLIDAGLLFSLFSGANAQQTTIPTNETLNNSTTVASTSTPPGCDDLCTNLTVSLSLVAAATAVTTFLIYLCCKCCGKDSRGNDVCCDRYTRGGEYMGMN